MPETRNPINSMIIPDDGTTEEYREAAHHWQEKWRQADAACAVYREMLTDVAALDSPCLARDAHDLLESTTAGEGTLARIEGLTRREQQLTETLEQVMRERDEARAKHQALSGAVNRLARAISQT